MNERKNHSRRNFLGLSTIPVAAAISTIFPEYRTPKEVDLSRYRKFTVAHNAAINPTTLHEAMESEVNFIEVDLTIVDGKLVVAHTPAEYLRLTKDQQSKQDPKYVIEKIVSSGKKIMWDIKDEILSLEQLTDIAKYIEELPNSMASSNNHTLLSDLQKIGKYRGRVLYSIGNEMACSAFLEASKGRNLASENAGVSIRHSLLKDDVPNRLQTINATIAAWNPETSVDIANAAIAGAQIITSGKIDLLVQLGKPDLSAMPSVPQSPVQE